MDSLPQASKYNKKSSVSRKGRGKNQDIAYKSDAKRIISQINPLLLPKEKDMIINKIFKNKPSRADLKDVIQDSLENLPQEILNSIVRRTRFSLPPHLVQRYLVSSNITLDDLILSSEIPDIYYVKNKRYFCRATFDLLKERLKKSLNEIPEYNPRTFMDKEVECLNLNGILSFLGLPLSRVGELIEQKKILSRENEDENTIFSFEEIIKLKCNLFTKGEYNE